MGRSRLRRNRGKPFRAAATGLAKKDLVCPDSETPNGQSVDVDNSDSLLFSACRSPSHEREIVFPPG